jgi:hypothetical protein
MALGPEAMGSPEMLHTQFIFPQSPAHRLCDPVQLYPFKPCFWDAAGQAQEKTTLSAIIFYKKAFPFIQNH